MCPQRASTLEGKAAVVTGGSKGYGRGIAGALAAAGARVWITGRSETALGEAAAATGAAAIRADATSPGDWDRVFKTVLNAAGRLDILVNNAGGGVRIAPMDEQTDEAIAESIALNLTGVLYGCRRAAPVMKRQGGGIIINVSSGCALHAWPGWAPYSAAKAGLNQFSHCLYTELRASGVRVTTVTPYWGATDFTQAAGIAHVHPAATPEIRRQCIQPQEMGSLVVNLCAMPPHLEVPDIVIQPTVQPIEPL
ncbi:MAG: putative oxidoreductase [Lentisphaerae bacterium ADurb.BinA184]|nr:MAG: putative oxidoreductase [Lentisphaerae bacterium ADurb.BinA184]